MRMRTLFGIAKRRVAQEFFERLPGSSTAFGPPRGYHSTIDDLVDNGTDVIRMTEATPQQTNIYRPAKTEEYIPHWKFDERHSRFVVAAQSVYHLKQGRVVGIGATVVSPDDKVVLDCSAMWGAYYDPLFFRPKLPPLNYLPGVAVQLANPPGGNISHFVMDCLPRLQAYSESCGQTETEARFIVNGKGHPYINGLLDAFSIPERLRIYVGDDLHVQCEHLILFKDSVHGHPTKRFIDFIREHCSALYAERRTSQKRIYVSREYAGLRRIRNSQEVETVLARYGFEKTHLENLSFQEQVNLFHDAEIVFSPHGAGLINMIYCQPGAKIIELLPRAC